MYRGEVDGRVAVGGGGGGERVEKCQCSHNPIISEITTFNVKLLNALESMGSKLMR